MGILSPEQTIFLRLAGYADPAAAEPRYSLYRIAGRSLIVDRPVGEVASFGIELPASYAAAQSNHSRKRAGDSGRLVFDDGAWVGNATRRVRCWYDESSYEIRIAGVGAFSVSADGREIVLLERVSAVDDGVLIEAALGPALIVALAIGGIFCLHASAVTFSNSAVLFLGDSGAGKSTLAKMLRNRGAGVERIADDICPLRDTKSRFHLLPDFPQLKLAASEQQTGDRASPMPVKAIYDLRRTAVGKAVNPPISRQRLDAVDAFKCLVGQSVASRLFPKEVLLRHTRKIAELVRLVPVYRLTYPSGAEHADAVREFLLAKPGYSECTEEDFLV